MRIPTGKTDRYVYFVAVDPTDLKTRETGLSSFTVYGSLNGAAAVAFTEPTVNETESTHMKGVYELLVDEQTTLTAGNDTEELCLHITHASMAPVTMTVEIYRPETTEGNTALVDSDGRLDIIKIAGEDAVVALAAGVWDRVISRANHNIANSAGKKLRLLENIFVMEEGTAQNDGGGDDTIRLAATVDVVDTWFTDAWIMLVDGLGEGQMRHVESYDNTTKILTIDRNWDTKPDNTTDYVIVSRSTVHVHGLEAAAKAEINAEVDTALNDYGANTTTPPTVAEIWAQAMSDLAAGAPSSTASVLTGINYLYEAWRNKMTTSSSEIAIYKDDGTTKLVESDISDDGSTFTKGEYGAAD